MNRLGDKVFSSALACLVAVSLAACGGRGSHSALPPVQVPDTIVPAGSLVAATFTINIPAPTKTSAKARRPAYISAATKSVRVNMTADTAGVPITAQFNVVTNVTNSSGNAPGAPCTGSGPWTCTVTMQVPPGNDGFTFTTYDAAGGIGNVLSQQIQTLTLVKGTANAFNVTFDANAGAISLSGTQPCTAGSIAAVFGSGNGTSPVTINVSFTDPASKSIPTNAPGYPVIAIKDADGTFHTTSGVIHGTGGDVNFSINQSTSSFNLTPTTVPITNASVIVQGTARNSTGSSDGLPFNQQHTFAFSASTAPPTHNFLGVVEQNGAGTSGQINFFTVTLGGSGAADTLNPYTNAQSTTTLPTTNSINESAPDVDNPEAIVFDSGGNLLIANGGQGGAVTSYAPSGDYGNFACVPSGAISTGAALSTTNQTNLHVPDAIDVSSDGTVAIANNPASATKNVQDFSLPGSGNYTAGTSFTNPGGFGVPLGRPLVNMPTLTTGTFAFTLFDGTNSKLVILAPSGTTSTVTNSTDTHLNNPFALAWDSVNNQLVVGDNNTPDGHHQSYLNFYTVGNPPAAPTNVKSFFMQPDPDPADDCVGGNPCAGLSAQRIAVAPTSGYVAVAGINGYNSTYGGGEIQFYDSSHNALANGVLAFDTADTAANACSGSADPTANYTFGESGFKFTELQWLSSTKLLVLIENPNKTSVQGIYIYDVSVRTAAQTGFWGPYSSTTHTCTATAPPTGPTRTFFQSVTSLIPFAGAYKP